MSPLSDSIAGLQLNEENCIQEATFHAIVETARGRYQAEGLTYNSLPASHKRFIEGPFYIALLDMENEEKEGNLPVVVAKATQFFSYSEFCRHDRMLLG